MTCEWGPHWEFFYLCLYGLKFDMVRGDTCVDGMGGVWDSNMTHIHKYSTIKKQTYGINVLKWWKCSFESCFDPPILCIPYLDILSSVNIDHLWEKSLTRIAWRNKTTLPFTEVVIISFWNYWWTLVVDDISFWNRWWSLCNLPSRTCLSTLLPLH